MADNKEPIYEDTLPAVSLGDGPFTRKDTGDSGIGYCSIPSRGVGEFGIPSGIPEEMIRAVEMHEYMHLSLINMVPEIQDMHLQMRKDGVPDKIIQGVGDLIVNSISKDEHVRSTLEGLRLADSDEKLLEYMIHSNTMERIVLGVRAQSTSYLSTQFYCRILPDFLSHLISHPEPHEDGLTAEELIAKKKEEVELISNTVKGVSKAIGEQAGLFSRALAYPGMGTDDIHENVSLMAIPPEKRDIYENICLGPIKRDAMADAIALSEMVKTVYQIAENTKAVEEMKERERRDDTSSFDEEEDEGESSTTPSDAAEDPDEVLEKARKYDASHIRTHTPRSIREKVPWGEMTIVTIPFTETLRNDMTRRKVRYGLEGPFRYPHRMPPAGDGSCFSRKRKIRGGTVLIDWSGSMGLTNRDVRDIIMQLPAATVAAYSGSGAEGYLMILAKDGMIGDLRGCDGYRGGGNIIDGPALEWLASQQKPQIWVSDGHVTGVSDCPSTILTSEVMAFITNRRIIRIPNLSVVKQFVQKHRNMFLH